jgi:uncharacterized protein (UPF0332 family)
MNLKDCLSKGYLRKHETTQKEISALLRIAERDLRTAEKLCDEIDWQFAIAYNAALQLASIPIRASGYRATTKTGHHWITFATLPVFLGKEFDAFSSYFDDCRWKRNQIEYMDTGSITKEEALKLIHETKKLKKIVLVWLKKYYPALQTQKATLEQQ